MRWYKWCSDNNSDARTPSFSWISQLAVGIFHCASAYSYSYQSVMQWRWDFEIVQPVIELSITGCEGGVDDVSWLCDKLGDHWITCVNNLWKQNFNSTLLRLFLRMPKSPLLIAKSPYLCFWDRATCTYANTVLCQGEWYIKDRCRSVTGSGYIPQMYHKPWG